MSKLLIQQLTGKSEMDRLRTLVEGSPALTSYKTDKLTSKMWIDPNGDVIPLTSWHWEYFKSPDISKKWGITPTNEQETRLAALNSGFIRVNYEHRNGALTVESGTAGWTRHAKDVVFMLIADNLSAIDNISVSILSSDGKIVRNGYSALFSYDDREKLEHIPLISESKQGKDLLAIFRSSLPE